jgi:hypothetical protein
MRPVETDAWLEIESIRQWHFLPAKPCQTQQTIGAEAFMNDAG